MDDFAADTRFHGFEKIPVVMLTHTDITPYLKMMRERPSSIPYYNEYISKNGLTLKDCFVKVERSDLKKLKNSLLTNTVSCRICKKSYSDMKKLRNHQETKHMIVLEPKIQKRVSFSDHVTVHELKEYHKCRKCSRIFEDYKSLKIHMKKDHKKRKCYICNYCTKSFVERSIFKFHIKLHCDVCTELLPNRAQYIEHRKNVCHIIKMYKCKTCSDSYYSLMDLKDHSFYHFNECYVCDICKDQLQSKCAVSHHIAFLHSSTRPVSLYECRNLGNERLYLCNFCNETSVEKEPIEKHVGLLPDLFNRLMTGYKDYYFCDHCLRKYDTEEKMLQHKWTHFLQNNNTNNTETISENVTNEKSKNNNMIINSTENMLPNVSEKLPDDILKTDTKHKKEIPKHMLPNVVLEKLPDDLLKNDKNTKNDTGKEKYVANEDKDLNMNNGDENLVSKESNNLLNIVLSNDKHVVDCKSKKTILSKHLCEQCNKYYSSNYNLKRHILTQHPDIENLQCQVCEEIFVWPSLLRSHNCIRSQNIPEMPFDDARPEIHFDNLNMFNILNGEPDMSIDNDYMDYVDFEVPAPIVEIKEYEGGYIPNSNFNGTLPNKNNLAVVSSGKAANRNNMYKIVVQEIPIEF